MDEIKLMKDIGSHINIVNMMGCRTLIEPLYLVVELVPYGDLLNFLRKRRHQVSIEADCTSAQKRQVFFIRHCAVGLLDVLPAKQM